MPLYEYRCEACQHRFEVIQKFSDAQVSVCPNCGKGPVVKLMSSPAIQFKGSGFYITDYARKDSGKSGSSDSGKSGDSGKSSESGKSGDSGKASGSETGGSAGDSSAASTPSKSDTSSKKTESTPAKSD